jgi:type IV secretory pathway TraG/TraD family ATPase VirD4
MTPNQGKVALDLGAHLWAIAWPILAGLLVGYLALGAFERRHLRWSWSLFGIPIAYVVIFIEWHLGLVLAIATVTAVWLGARVHSEAIQHGGEEARLMRESQSPLRWGLSRVTNKRARQDRLRKGRLAIGTSRGGKPCTVPFGLDRGVHALISGATGSGKTVTEAGAVDAYADAGFGAIVIDPKGDPYLRATAIAAAKRNGVRFTEWTPAGPGVYNPLARGGPTEIADKALAAHRWSEPHYELATQRLLGHVLSTMQAAGHWPPTLSGLVRYMEPERLDALATEVGGETGERVHTYVDSLSERAKADLGGGRDRLSVLIDSELGPWLDPTLGKGEAIDLLDCLRHGEIVYFNLDADRYPNAAKLMASAVVIDLVGLSAEMQGTHVGGLVVIDEFAAIAPEHVSRLFARARSANLSLHLGTQSLADLRGARPGDPSDTLTEQVLSNIEYAVVHRCGDPDSAERFARMAGTAPSWSVTQKISGNGTMLGVGEGTRTREREFLILPDQFKRLRTGEAVVIDHSAKRPAQIVRIWPPRG